MKKGFTLIELLVVIAIIGILSSVVLASLNNARSKGTDVKIQTQLYNIKGAAEIANVGGSYGTAVLAKGCEGLVNNTNLVTFMSGASWPNNKAPDCTSNAALGGSITAYSVWHQLTASGAGWCVDSTGVSTSSAIAPTSGKNCSNGDL